VPGARVDNPPDHKRKRVSVGTHARPPVRNGQDLCWLCGAVKATAKSLNAVRRVNAFGQPIETLGPSDSDPRLTPYGGRREQGTNFVGDKLALSS
jgi:hypothetical protein